MQFRKANGSVYEKELFIKLGKLLLNLESDFLSFFFFFQIPPFLETFSYRNSSTEIFI